jgi:hypothetical protein
MFNMTLGSTGYEWRCTFTGCTAAGQGTNAAETAQDAVRHRDREHPEMVWSIPRQNAVQDVLLWLQDQEGSENLKVAPASVMKLVNTIARTLGLPQADTPLPTIAEVANWGKDPLTMENMGDIRLIEAPRSSGPPATGPRTIRCAGRSANSSSTRPRGADARRAAHASARTWSCARCPSTTRPT